MADINKRGVIERTAEEREIPIRELLQELYFDEQTREGVAARLGVAQQTVARAMSHEGLQEVVILVPSRSDEYHIGYDKVTKANIWDNRRWQLDAYDRLAARILEYLADRPTPRIDEVVARLYKK